MTMTPGQIAIWQIYNSKKRAAIYFARWACEKGVKRKTAMKFFNAAVILGIVLQ